MSETLLVALLNFATKFGLDVGLAFAQNIGGAATIDDAITALKAAQAKSADSYIAVAKAALAVTPAATPTPAA